MALIVLPHSWIPGLNLTWARSNLGSQLTCMVGFEFPAPDDSRQRLYEITFLCLSSLNFFPLLF